ncbi:hypothetical protein PG985_015561 [Apiospora marii]|uniref:Uncharacterized protein n=1 Tax=Apiospora marii TaxID=335849 RepID=A0ABR1S5D2_9PEZI
MPSRAIRPPVAGQDYLPVRTLVAGTIEHEGSKGQIRVKARDVRPDVLPGGGLKKLQNAPIAFRIPSSNYNVALSGWDPIELEADSEQGVVLIHLLVRLPLLGGKVRSRVAVADASVVCLSVGPGRLYTSIPKLPTTIRPSD